MSARTSNFTVSFSTAFNAIIAGGLILLTALTSWLVYAEGRNAALDDAQSRFVEIAANVRGNVENLLQSAAALTDAAALALQPAAPAQSGDDSRALAFMKAVLDQNPDLMSAYIGFNDGAFLQVISVRGDRRLLETYRAPARTSHIERIIARANGERRQLWRFLDKEGTALLVREDQNPQYDPRERVWFKDAGAATRSVFTAPYVFSSSRLPGVTCARLLADGRGVFGVDLSLAQLGGVLERQKVSPHGTVWLVDQDGRLTASPGLAPGENAGGSPSLPEAAASSDPVLRAAAQALADHALVPSGKALLLTIAGESYLAYAIPLSGGLTTDSPREMRLTALIAAPESDVTSRIDRMLKRIMLLAALALIPILGIAFLAGKRVMRPITILARDAENIRRFNFARTEEPHSHIREIKSLSSSYQVMKAAIRAKTEGLYQARNTLERLVEGGLALSAEKDLSNLVSLIFHTAKDIAKADGGAIYLKENGGFGVELLSLKSESLVFGGISGRPAPRVMVRPEILPFLNKHSVLFHACQALGERGCSRYSGEPLELFPTGLAQEPTDYAIRSLVSAPIITRRDEVLGVLQLFNPAAFDQPQAEDAVEPDIEDFLGSLAAQAAVTLDNRNLVNALEELFDALIRVVATSIDAKSPYTAGHCARVPEIAGMLAKAAVEADQGPLEAFRISGKDAWRQLWIASWLHDCGKIITPGHVVDKATKLECVHNRIHEIRCRFEILRRDAEIRRLEHILETGDAARANEVFEREIASLEEEFAFVARCNIGGEFMSDADKERLARIGQRTFLRHFSDRLGLSIEELRAKTSEEPPLPATETLLADKPEHRVKRLNHYQDMRDASGAPLAIPENKYNLGELYNLSISRGTLTDEERFIINEHALSGMRMLRNIPFPEQLSRVAEIATAHHENLKGTGYPLKKDGAQLPMEARILAIADIFEALTAADRPYKKAKTIADALSIMAGMRDDNIIDADLFDVFLEKKVYAAYAEKFLTPEQQNVSGPAPYFSKGYHERRPDQGDDHAHA